MLIGGDVISNDVITLGTCFSNFVYIRARFCFALIGGNLTAQTTASHRGIVGIVAVLHFPAPPPQSPGELARRLDQLDQGKTISVYASVVGSTLFSY